MLTNKVNVASFEKNTLIKRLLIQEFEEVREVVRLLKVGLSGP